jgi:hypothetical protein
MFSTDEDRFGARCKYRRRPLGDTRKCPYTSNSNLEVWEIGT